MPFKDFDIDEWAKRVSQNKATIAEYRNRCITCKKEIKPGDKVIAKGGLYACLPQPEYCLDCGREAQAKLN